MYKTLIIDDEPIIRQGLQSIIPWEEYGFRVCGEASNGKEGIQKINTLDPDLIIVDVRMPEMSGLDMLKEIKERRCKAIILSGHSDFKYAQEAMEYDVDYYLLKPIDRQEFCEKVQSVYESIQKHSSVQHIENSDFVIEKVIEYISENFQNDIKLEKLASMFNYNSAYLGKLFKSEKGLNFNTYLDTVRIDKAKQLLKKGMKVYLVAQEVGYDDVRYFYKKFQKYVGVSPSAYKKSDNNH